MTISDERLHAFVAGELDEAARAEIEAALASDGELRARVERMRRRGAALGGAYDPALNEPVPDRRAPLMAEAEETNVVAFPPRAKEKRTRPSGVQWAALAAGFAGALFVGRMSAPESGPFVLRGDGVYAGARLERVLTTQLASTQNPNAATRIGITFRARDGAFCRTFVLEGSVSGIACREAGAWAVRMMAPAERREGAFVQAASESEAILEAAYAMIDGEPFDAAGEAEAKRVGWR